MKITNRRVWPVFRSFRPGYLPWTITLTEARFLTHALKQILEIATSLRDGVKPFHPSGRRDKDGMLMRVSRETEDGIIWEDQVWKIERPKTETVAPVLDPMLLEQLKLIQPSALEMQVDLILGPGRIEQVKQRPQALYMLMAADSESGFLFGIEAMVVENSLNVMRATIPNSLAKMLLQHRVVPKRVIVRADWLRQMLRILTQSLNIEMIHADDLPRIDEAADSMIEWMQREL